MSFLSAGKRQPPATGRARNDVERMKNRCMTIRTPGPSDPGKNQPGDPGFRTRAVPAERRDWRSTAATVLLSSVLFLPGCTVGPNYRRPNVNAPAVFRGAAGAAQQASFADLPWWEVFHDETLKELVKTSLTNNYDLAAAVARVEQARQVAAQARAEYFPAISYSTVTSYGHNQFINSPASNSPGAQGFFLGIARAAWEADVWGRIRRTN